tara:strand:- start:350 stop:661 length:312 start_codon:yes stop_codon:yes gene_type:complete
MAKTRKAGKRGGVKLSPREKATRSKQRKLKTAENKIARLEKRLATADKKVQAAQNKLDNVYLNAKARVDKENQNAENINIMLQQARIDYDNLKGTPTYNSVSM